MTESPQIANFGRNVVFRPTDFYAPRSEEEVLAVLDRHRGRQVRCMGRLHSWSAVAACAAATRFASSASTGSSGPRSRRVARSRG